MTQSLKTRILKVLGAVVPVVVLAGLIGGPYLILGQQEASGLCAAPGEQADTKAVAAEGTATATVSDGAVTSFTLGTDINSGPRSVPFALSAPVAGSRVVEVSAGPFTDPSDGQQLPPGHMQAWAALDPTGTTGAVTVCLPPDRREAGPWGTFSGSVTIQDPRIETTPIGVTVSASYPDRQTVFLVWAAACLLASGYVFFLRDGHSAGSGAASGSDAVLRSDFGFIVRYWKYMTGIVGVVTVAAGLTLASGVYAAQYLRGAAWSGDIDEWLAFCGAVAAAFVAGGTAGRLAQNVYANPAG